MRRTCVDAIALTLSWQYVLPKESKPLEMDGNHVTERALNWEACAVLTNTGFDNQPTPHSRPGPNDQPK